VTSSQQLVVEAQPKFAQALVSAPVSAAGWDSPVSAPTAVWVLEGAEVGAFVGAEVATVTDFVGAAVALGATVALGTEVGAFVGTEVGAFVGTEATAGEEGQRVTV